jgi:glycosyltransferase involved in cell wall biosynthesis
VQTKEEIEIILIDDGSTNDSISICNECMRKDSRIVVIHQENQGVSIARNRGIIESKGKWIAFVDSDDWLECNYLEKLYEKADSDVDIILCDCFVNYKNKEVKNQFLPFNTASIVENKIDLIYQILCKGFTYSPPEISLGVPWGKLFRKDFIISNKLAFVPNMIRMQDNVFWMCSVNFAQKIIYIPLMLYHYRRENTSVCFRYNPNIIMHFEEYFLEVQNFIAKTSMGYNSNLIDALNIKILASFNSYMLYNFFHKKNSLSYFNARKNICILLKQAPYENAINRVKFSQLTVQEKIFIFCLKFRLVEFIYLFLEIKKIWISKF